MFVLALAVLAGIAVFKAHKKRGAEVHDLPVVRGVVDGPLG
jgi:hypothetical protein